MIGIHPFRFIRVATALFAWALILTLTAGCGKEWFPTQPDTATHHGVNRNLNALEIERDFGKRFELETEGYVDEIDYDGGRFRVAQMWFWVDDETEIDIEFCNNSCTFNTLRQGNYVKVKYASHAMNGVLYYAAEIEVEGDDADEPGIEETRGYVDAVDHLTSRLRVAGKWFWADGLTGIDVDHCDGEGAFSDVLVGDQVKVEHPSDPDEFGGFYATKIEVVGDGDFVETKGSVDEIDHDMRRLSVAGMWFQTRGCTEIEIDDDEDRLSLKGIYKNADGRSVFDDIRVEDVVTLTHSLRLIDGAGYIVKKVAVLRGGD